MSPSLQELRAKLDELRAAETSIARWRSLQLQVLVAARSVQRTGFTQAAPAEGQALGSLWSLLGEPFWVEADLKTLAEMIDNVLVELESIAATQQRQSS